MGVMGSPPVASVSLKKKRFLSSLHSYIAIEEYSSMTIDDLARIFLFIPGLKIIVRDTKKMSEDY